MVDRGGIGSGMTARTNAHLASALDGFYSELIKSRDQNIARPLHESLALPRLAIRAGRHGPERPRHYRFG
jgi:hypothetical protein